MSYSKKSIPSNKALYNKIKNEAKKRFKKWPSAYGSAWLVKEYKRRGGKYKGSKKSNLKGISRWMKEKWINVCKLPKKVSCGRSKLSKNWKKNYPYCRPSIRISSSTPRLASSLSKAEIKRRCSKKRKEPMKRLIIKNKIISRKKKSKSKKRKSKTRKRKSKTKKRKSSYRTKKRKSSYRNKKRKSRKRKSKIGSKKKN